MKGISFPNPAMASRIVEWIELLFILGVEKIFFHYYNIAEEILQVFNYYEAKGLLDAKAITWGGLYST